MKKLKNAENNMGNTTEEDTIKFFEEVKTDLMEPISLEFTTAGSICIGSRILIDYKDLQYPWFTKQMILHEIAHYLEPDDETHGIKFHYQFANLVQRYLGNGSFFWMAHERGYNVGLRYAKRK